MPIGSVPCDRRAVPTSKTGSATFQSGQLPNWVGSADPDIKTVSTPAVDKTRRRSHVDVRSLAIEEFAGAIALRTHLLPGHMPWASHARPRPTGVMAGPAARTLAPMSGQGGACPNNARITGKAAQGDRRSAPLSTLSMYGNRGGYYAALRHCPALPCTALPCRNGSGAPLHATLQPQHPQTKSRLHALLLYATSLLCAALCSSALPCAPLRYPALLCAALYWLCAAVRYSLLLCAALCWLKAALRCPNLALRCPAPALSCPRRSTLPHTGLRCHALVDRVSDL